jgi:hypothetical protein
LKKLLIVNQNSGYLTIDVANSFKEEYDEVVVMFGLNRVTARNFHPDIKIQKTITYDRSSTFKRLWTWGICTLHLSFLLMWKYRGYKVLYYTNPPMSYFNAMIFPNPFSIVVFDAYPDTLKLFGIPESSLIFKMWAKINKKVFKKSKQIIVLSEGMKNLLRQYVDECKIKVVPIWSASDQFKPIPKKENSFLKQNHWEYKFIVLYSGNMGLGHKLEVLIYLAEKLKCYEEILFLFVGEGAKKKTLINMAEKKGLNNVSFLTWQTASVLPYSLAAGDIAVVALEPESTYASVPSKTFNYMSVGVPILAIGNSGSELEMLIKRFDMGMYASIHDVSEMVKFILNLKADKQQAEHYAKNAFHASKQFTYKQAEAYLF